MNIVKLQGIKLTQRNALHSYTLTKLRKLKEKLRKQLFTIARKRIKYLRINLKKQKTNIENYKLKVKVKSLNGVQLCDPMDSSLHQVPPSMGFSRQEYWSGLPFPSPGNLSDPGIEPRSPALYTDALPSEQLGKSRKL